MDSLKFRKYEEDGAYHWRATYSGGWRRSDPHTHARYDAAMERLAARVDLPRATGADLGCGDGVMLHKLLRRGARAVGVDLEPEGVRIAAAMLRRFGAAPGLACASVYRLPFASGSLQYVVALEVLEHLADARGWLDEVYRVLAPGGVVVLTTPQRTRGGALRDPYHVHEFMAAELRALLAERFADAVVEGQYPSLLHALYKHGAGWRPLDLAVRFGLKALAAAHLNLFTRITARDPGARWEGLIACARKA